MAELERLIQNVKDWQFDSDHILSTWLQNFNQTFSGRIEYLNNMLCNLKNSSSDLEQSIMNSYSKFTLLSASKFVKNEVTPPQPPKKEDKRTDDKLIESTQAEKYAKYTKALGCVLKDFQLAEVKDIDLNSSVNEGEEKESNLGNAPTQFRGKLPLIIGTLEFASSEKLGLINEPNSSTLTTENLNQRNNEQQNSGSVIQPAPSHIIGNNQKIDQQSLPPQVSKESNIIPSQNLAPPNLLNTSQAGNPVLAPQVLGNASGLLAPPILPTNPLGKNSLAAPVLPGLQIGFQAPPPLSADVIVKIVGTDVDPSMGAVKNDFQSSLKEILKERKAIVDGVKKGDLSISAVKKQENLLRGIVVPENAAANNIQNVNSSIPPPSLPPKPMTLMDELKMRHAKSNNPPIVKIQDNGQLMVQNQIQASNPQIQKAEINRGKSSTVSYKGESKKNIYTSKGLLDQITGTKNNLFSAKDDDDNDESDIALPFISQEDKFNENKIFSEQGNFQQQRIEEKKELGKSAFGERSGFEALLAANNINKPKDQDNHDLKLRNLFENMDDSESKREDKTKDLISIYSKIEESKNNNLSNYSQSSGKNQEVLTGLSQSNIPLEKKDLSNSLANNDASFNNSYVQKSNINKVKNALFEEEEDEEIKDRINYSKNKFQKAPEFSEENSNKISSHLVESVTLSNNQVNFQNQEEIKTIKMTNIIPNISSQPSDSSYSKMEQKSEIASSNQIIKEKMMEGVNLVESQIISSENYSNSFDPSNEVSKNEEKVQPKPEPERSSAAIVRKKQVRLFEEEDDDD